MEKMLPLDVGRGTGTQLTKRVWKAVVGDGNKIGDVVKYVFAVHHFPGHWCCIVADFERKRTVYYDPLCGGPYAKRACMVFKRYLQSECKRQDSRWIGV